ncbi:hypothetical protein D3P08_14585 [Paenibacillus nanensis]|uniref:DUF5301 domain-containing protein n=1 Tax=Paenibacillus nanensis TaxID=393251 RepID=A0A3A1UYD6_9BACL|nr:DUF5301 domain-containing protein [Paenibacillus nanensis]RIX52192.1 hypothetical protein D3P08_14585 [Paenibacillus nanensis]
MKTRNKKTIVISIIVLLGVSVFLYLHFNKVFIGGELLELKDINKIEVTKADKNEKVNVTDARKVEEIKKTLNQLELKRDNNEDVSEVKDRFMLTLYTETEARYGVHLYDNSYIEIFDPELQGNKLRGYKVRSDFDLSVIQDLFK